MRPLDTRSLFSLSAREWIDQCRVSARELLMHREQITIDDVLKENPRPQYVHRNATGTVFKHGDFKWLGVTKATHKAANRRLVSIWGLADDLQAVKKMRNRVFSDEL